MSTSVECIDWQVGMHVSALATEPQRAAVSRQSLRREQAESAAGEVACESLGSL